MEEIREYFISEKGFKEAMETKVEPFLEDIREEGFTESLDGKNIHYEAYIREDAAASVVVCHGFCESAEKFREMSYYFYNMGYNVFAVDHRGHGKSEGHSKNPYIVYLKSFDNYVEDLNCIVEKVVKPASGNLPLYIYAHSMGGAIAVQYLQSYPEVFSKAVLSSPMIKAKTAGLPQGVAAFLARTFIVLGKGDSKVLGYPTFNAERTVDQSNDTSEERFNYYQAKRCANKIYQTAAPTFRWVSEAVKVAELNLDEKRCRKIKAKVLVCQPEEDADVVSEAEDKFCTLVKDARLAKFTECRHEIYNSVDATVLSYLKEIKDFLKA